MLAVTLPEGSPNGNLGDSSSLSLCESSTEDERMFFSNLACCAAIYFSMIRSSKYRRG